MVRIGDKVRTVRREEGIKQLAKSAAAFLYHNIHRKISEFRGGLTVRVDSSSADFYPETHKEYLALNYIIEEEQALLQDILSELDSTDIFWDVGANLGVHSCLAAEQLTSGTVIAFEPYRPNAARLKQNRSLNDLDNVSVVKRALSDSIGTESFSQPRRDEPGNQWTALVPDTVDDNSESIQSSVDEVETDTGDGLVDAGLVPQPNVVKIDVEGASPLVIQGMKRTLSDKECRTVYCEVHLPSNMENSRPATTDFGVDPQEISEMLEALGFAVEIIDEREADFFIKARAKKAH